MSKEVTFDIDTRFVKDIKSGEKLSLVQIVAHVAAADACHYYYVTVTNHNWDLLTPDEIHLAAHQAFDHFAEEFESKNTLAQVYCRTFMQVCAYLVLNPSTEVDRSKELTDEIVARREFSLHFMGLESNAGGGNSVISVNIKEKLNGH